MSFSGIRIALAVLWLPGNRLLLQRRDGAAPISPHLLSCFGGHLEPGESPSFAMARELEEETSLRGVELAPLAVFTAQASGRPAGQTVEVNVFSADLSDAAIVAIEVYEGAGSEVHAFSDALARPDVAPTTRAVLQHPAVARR